MVPDSRARRRVRGPALLLLCLGLMMVLPGQSGAAVISVAQNVDNSQGDFADGNFQRTSIGPAVFPFTVTSPDLPDAEGLVQLAPAGVLNPWDSIPITLPIKVADAGVTAVGKHIYVIGGTITGVGGFTDAAYWATVDPKTGALVALPDGTNYWTNTPMPTATAITDSVVDNAPSGCPTPVAKRTRAGVASVTTGTNTGYIYVVGGAVDPDPLNCVTGGTSTGLIQRGKVAADGTITWTTLPTTSYLPSPLPFPSTDDGITNGSRHLGVEGASVVIVHTKSSTSVDHYFLYVFGGKSRYLDLVNSGNTRVRALATVYYSEINMADGSLKHPTNGSTTSVWARDKNISLVATPATDEGLWDATASAANVTVGTDLKSAIFLAGGSLDSDTSTPNITKLNPYIYRADVNKDTGVLTWATGPNTVGPAQIALAARRGMVSVNYNNKLYMIGGRTADSLSTGLATVPTAFFDDNLDLIKLDPLSADYFTGVSPTDVVLKAGAPGYRSSLGAAVVRAESPTSVVGTLNSAWVYVLGGDDQNGAYCDTIFLGKIGGDEAQTTVRAPDGWYYSGVIKTSFELGSGSNIQNKQSRVLALHWATDIDRTTTPKADVMLEFRKTITASGECLDESIFTSSADDRWRGPIDGFTSDTTFYSKAAADGALYNNVTMSDIFGTEQLNASCIQYRAHLMQNASGSSFSPTAISPKLLSVYIEKIVVGNADLNIPTTGLSVSAPNGSLASLVMQVQNLSDKGLSDTLSVSDARLAANIKSAGSFYVFLCMARTDLAQAEPSLALPDPNASLPIGYETICPAYAMVAGGEMDKGTILDLSLPTNAAGDPRWYNNTTNQPISDIKSLFTTFGHYRLGLVIDPLDLVPEGISGESNNRGETVANPSGTTIAFDLSAAPSTKTIVLLPLVTR
ncbi:MAG: hypothetical protein WCJ55_15645 [Chloroflexales bacterium]